MQSAIESTLAEGKQSVERLSAQQTAYALECQTTAKQDAKLLATVKRNLEVVPYQLTWHCMHACMNGNDVNRKWYDFYIRRAGDAGTIPNDGDDGTTN